MVKNKLNLKKKEEERIIPLKNYIIVIVILAVTVGLTFFIRNWYQSYENYQKTIPILKNVVSELRSHEIDSYISDNPSTIVYIGVADDVKCRILESDLKKLIIKNHLKDKIVYFNITDVTDREKLLTDFNSKYLSNGKIANYPAMVIFDEGEVIAFRSKTTKQDLLISDIEQLFEEYEVYGD